MLLCAVLKIVIVFIDTVIVFSEKFVEVEECWIFNPFTGSH